MQKIIARIKQIAYELGFFKKKKYLAWHSHDFCLLSTNKTEENFIISPSSIFTLNNVCFLT